MNKDTIKSIQSDARRRPKPFDFKPAKPKRWVIALFKSLIPMILRNKLKVAKVEISDEDLEKLRNLKGKRCLLMPSHSGGFEPFIILYLSRLLKDFYYYVAAIEAFEESLMTCWVMQRLGAYSIVRGAPDRQSFQTTKKIMVDGKRWLVIFPEGQTVWQNDTVIPFQQGVVQLAFKACEELEKKGKESSLHCIPVSIKYVYMNDMQDEILKSLDRLEEALFSPDAENPTDPLDRLRHISETVLTANEKKHGVKPPKDSSFEERILAMKEKVVTKIEDQLNVSPKGDHTLLDRIRTLFNAVDKITHEEPEENEYALKLQEERQQAARELYNDLWRVLQFIGIYGEYVIEFSSQERFLDVLCLLEMEVFSKRRMWGPRKACIKVGTPINLKDRMPEYLKAKPKVCKEITDSLEYTVREMLLNMAAKETPSSDINQS